MTDPATPKPRLGFSLGRIGTIAANTFTEALRQKVFNVLLLVALALIASGLFFRQFSFSEQFKFVKDTGLGFIAFFGSLIAIVGTAQMLPSELENRTIYTLLAKPVRRVEFLLGKYAGSVLLLFISLLLMSLMFGAELKIMERGAIRDLQINGPETDGVTLEQAIRDVQAEATDVDLAKAVLLILVKVALLAAITLFFSTFSTSMVFNVTMGFMAWIAGSLVEPVRDVLAQHRIALALLAMVPDLGAFNVADEIVQGLSVSWDHVALVATYGLARTALVLGAAYLIFSQREI